MKVRNVMFAAYCVCGMASLTTLTLYMISPEFREWANAKSREYSYRIAKWNYDRNHKPVPEWVKKAVTVTEFTLPDED